jgi:hypothetical protein
VRGAPSMIGKMLADKPADDSDKENSGKKDKKDKKDDETDGDDKDGKKDKKKKKRKKKSKDSEPGPDASSEDNSKALAINLEPEPVNLNLRQLEARQLLDRDAPVPGAHGASSCEFVTCSLREKDKVTLGEGEFQLPRYWWATQMNGVGGIKGEGADKTVLHLPPGGMWFGGGEDGRVPGGPTKKCETKRATVERMRKRVVTLQVRSGRPVLAPFSLSKTDRLPEHARDKQICNAFYCSHLYINRSFYQDRLGKNIGKTQKKDRVSAGCDACAQRSGHRQRRAVAEGPRPDAGAAARENCRTGCETRPLLSHLCIKFSSRVRHLYVKTIILPRQARDKHRES